MSQEVAQRTPSRTRQRVPQLVAALAAVFLIGSGLWAMTAPQAFFAAAATFEPYNAHLIRDVGSFMLGIGAVLLLAAAKPAVEALAVALLGAGIGTAAHTISHVVDRDLGGTPSVDLPIWTVWSVLLLLAGLTRWRTPTDTT